MSPDEQEALSRRYGDDIIILLSLSSGNVAVFNSARELCGFVSEFMDHNEIEAIWHLPSKAPKDFSLEDLGL